MCKWNLHKFAEALVPALPLADSQAALEKYDGLYKGYYEEGMRRFGVGAIGTYVYVCTRWLLLFLKMRTYVPARSFLRWLWLGFPGRTFGL